MLCPSGRKGQQIVRVVHKAVARMAGMRPFLNSLYYSIYPELFSEMIGSYYSER